jgi:hypothetical protein
VPVNFVFEATEFEVTADGRWEIAVRGWGQRRELLVNEIGSYDGTVRTDGAQVIQVTADDNWTFEAG